MAKSKKQPLTDAERQAFIDKLTKDQINPKAKETFDTAIARAALQRQSRPEKLAENSQLWDGSKIKVVGSILRNECKELLKYYKNWVKQ